MRKKSYFIIMFIFIAMFNVYTVEVEFFPDLLSPLSHNAISLSPEFNFSYIYNFNKMNDYAHFGAGGKFSLISVIFNMDLTLSSGGYAVISSIFDVFSDSFNYIHSDFQMGIFFDLKYNNLLLEIFTYHTSSHLGDDLIRVTGDSVINIGYEVIKGYLNYNPIDILFLSVGLEYKWNKRPVSLIFYNASLFLGLRLNLLERSIPFYIDSEIEVIGLDYSPNFGMKVGIILNYFQYKKKQEKKHEKGKTRSWGYHEAYLGYYTGYSKKGYFYSQREQLFSAGFSYRF